MDDGVSHAIISSDRWSGWAYKKSANLPLALTLAKWVARLFNDKQCLHDNVLSRKTSSVLTWKRIMLSKLIWLWRHSLIRRHISVHKCQYTRHNSKFQVTLMKTQIMNTLVWNLAPTCGQYTSTFYWGRNIDWGVDVGSNIFLSQYGYATVAFPVWLSQYLVTL